MFAFINVHVNSTLLTHSEGWMSLASRLYLPLQQIKIAVQIEK